MPTLSTAEEKFVLHWGEMGNRWGVNRTMAQIHALLMISEAPLNAEEIASTLAVARSNVSTSIRELMSWGIVKPVHLLGDRREHYESMKDPWDLFWTITAERKRRELDPTADFIKNCLAEMEADPDYDNPYAKERMTELMTFIENLGRFYSQLCAIPTQLLVKFLGSKTWLEKLMKFLMSGGG